MTRNVSEAIPALLAEGGALVCSSSCDNVELSFARSEHRFFVAADGCGFVLRPRDWLDYAEQAIKRATSPSDDDTGEFDAVVLDAGQVTT